MGISTTTNRVSYLGDGVTQAFSFPYYFAKSADLLVYQYYAPITLPITPPVITQLTLGTDYTISGTVINGLYSGGGTVNTTAVPDTDTSIVITRDPIEQQNFALLYGGIIPSVPLVNELDYLTILVQRLRDLASRAVALADGDVESDFALALPPGMSGQESMLLGTNEAGNGWELVDPASFAGATGPAGPTGPTGPTGPAGSAGAGVTAVSSTTTLTAPSSPDNVYVPANASSASFTVTLPATSSATIGQIYTFKKVDSSGNAVTIATNGSDNILALTLISSVTLDYEGKSYTLVCRATGLWDLI